MKYLVIFAALLFALPAHAEVTIDWVTIGDPGNAPDTTGYGAVAETYRISKYEVTNAQYAEFLNAVAATDTYELYNTNMSTVWGGITRSGSSGSYTYSTIAGREENPVVFVSFYDALRFANWLHKGQPTGAQDSTTTEDGAYTMITESYPDGPFITRNADAAIFLPSEDEWYKAAYYDALSASYFDYPAGSDVQSTCSAPGATPNTANCDRYSEPPDGGLTDVGAYTGSAGPNDTFDQGGNAWELNETIVFGTARGLRGGSFVETATYLAASEQFGNSPAGEQWRIGFRVAGTCSSAPSLSLVGLLALTALLALVGYRWRRV